MIDADRLLSDTVDAPLHLPVTQAAPLPGGLVKATCAIATPLPAGTRDTTPLPLPPPPPQQGRPGRRRRGRRGRGRAHPRAAAPDPGHRRQRVRREDREDPRDRRIGERAPVRAAARSSLGSVRRRAPTATAPAPAGPFPSRRR